MLLSMTDIQTYLSELVEKVNDLFEGELSDEDRLVYVNHVKGKLLESEILVQQASNNSKGQFDNSPDLDSALADAIIDAFDAYTTMSKQALDSERVRAGLKSILLGPAQLYEALRARGGNQKWSRSFEQLSPVAKRDHRGYAACICANGNAAKYASSGVAWLCA